jgi:hypothetical protein
MRFLEVDHPEYRPPEYRPEIPATPEELYCWSFREGIGYTIDHLRDKAGDLDPFRYWRKEAEKVEKAIIRAEVEETLRGFLKDHP